ncbi:MAG TPA: triose-phosphate isomerase [Terriglobales bacterium]|nr:triose-phosphate isomerase [Terriglobales bacterium]
MRVPLVVGNWKMNGNQAECRVLATSIARGLGKKSAKAQVAVAPPFTALAVVGKVIRGTDIKLSAQNCHWQTSGAFTGEVSPTMISDLGCDYVILGHSERRHVFQESDDLIARKIAPVVAHGMRAILCVGETLAERDHLQTAKVIARQLRIALKGSEKGVIDKLEIAYEPVWAIGTGQNATPKQVDQVHRKIRTFLVEALGAAAGNRVRILYGGSVKPENAAELAEVDSVDGLLVGGASLKAETFLPIVRAF